MFHINATYYLADPNENIRSAFVGSAIGVGRRAPLMVLRICLIHLRGKDPAGSFLDLFTAIYTWNIHCRDSR